MQRRSDRIRWCVCRSQSERNEFILQVKKEDLQVSARGYGLDTVADRHCLGDQVARLFRSDCFARLRIDLLDECVEEVDGRLLVVCVQLIDDSVQLVSEPRLDRRL